jgi:hypothetical protein
VLSAIAHAFERVSATAVSDILVVETACQNGRRFPAKTHSGARRQERKPATHGNFPGSQETSLIGRVGGALCRIGGQKRSPHSESGIDRKGRKFRDFFRNDIDLLAELLGILIPPFPGSNPGAPAGTQDPEFFTETALFPRGFSDPFGNGFRPPFGNSVPLCSCSCLCAKRCACRLRVAASARCIVSLA